MQSVCELQIRKATQPELVRALQRFELPRMMRGATAAGWLASGGKSGVAMLWPSLPVASGFIWVPPLLRRQGIGTALLKNLIEAARGFGCEKIWGTFAVNLEIAAWLEKHGFHPRNTMREFILLLNQNHPRLQKALMRIQRRIPASARMISLREAVDEEKLNEAAYFLASHVGGLPGQIVQGVQKSLDNSHAQVFDLDCSIVLIDKGKVIGGRLTKFNPGINCWFLESIAVEEAYRGSWANIWLRTEGTRRMLEDGKSVECRFRARDDQKDTLRYAEHTNARLLETLKLMECHLMTDTK
jgi:GNAT superfamily N-acetyltransferase